MAVGQIERPRRYLVLWSGGLDSTWSLWTLLRETHGEVHAHHVIKRSRTDDGREASWGWAYERAAVRRMRPWLAAHARPLVYSESEIDLTAFRAFARDTVTAVFLGAQAALTAGFGPEDVLVMGANGDEDRSNDDDPAVRWRTAFRSLTWRSVVQAVYQADRTPEVTWLMPAPTRARQVADLSDALAAMTASCRRPRRVAGPAESFVACGVCVTCQAVAPHLVGVAGRDAAAGCKVAP